MLSRRIAFLVLAFLACKSEATRDDEKDDNQFREDVIQCEEAVARLQRACPDFDGSRVLCNYYFSYDANGCGPTQTDTEAPALSLAESRCVLDTPAGDLVAKGICKRAQEARAYTSRTISDDSGASFRETHDPVCR